MIVIQAPSVNLATMMITTVIPVAVAPIALIAILRRAPGPRCSAPVRDHAGLRHGEGQECAHGKERNETVRDTAESDEKNCGNCGEHANAFRIDEPASTVGERDRQKAIFGHGAADGRETGEGSVGGENQQQQDRDYRKIIKPAAAHNSAEHHGQDALVIAAIRVGCDQFVGFDEIGDSGKHDRERTDDKGQRAAGVFHIGIAERAHAVADRFDAGERGTTAGEGLHQQPGARGGDRPVKCGRWSKSYGMAATCNRLDDADADTGKHAGQEQIGGRHENGSGFANTAQIYDCEDEQSGETEG